MLSIRCGTLVWQTPRAIICTIMLSNLTTESYVRTFPLISQQTTLIYRKSSKRQSWETQQYPYSLSRWSIKLRSLASYTLHGSETTWNFITKGWLLCSQLGLLQAFAETCDTRKTEYHVGRRDRRCNNHIHISNKFSKKLLKTISYISASRFSHSRSRETTVMKEKSKDKRVQLITGNTTSYNYLRVHSRIQIFRKILKMQVQEITEYFTEERDWSTHRWAKPEQ